ncbi:MAG: ATP-binding cassette domain-containing protein [Alphaproteobacteria bacterium]|nr:MAG: ATP-binding cassette domain-containing protein [Alphaproteobacteria bacterium]
MNPGSVPKISLKDVHKSFGRNKVLQGVNLDVPKGSSIVVIGGSGTGKSVMIKTILGLISPERGSIKIDGAEVTTMRHSERERVLQRFGMLFQGGALFDSLSVWENVAFGLVQGQHMRHDRAKPIALESLAKVGLGSDVAQLRPDELSGGMRKRVALARAIATRPDVIFFDEPTTGLDPIMADVINDLIVERVKELGATTLSITHDMASARKIADYIAMLHEGKIIWFGKVSEIDNTNNPVVDQFIHGRAAGPIQMEVSTA